MSSLETNTSYPDKPNYVGPQDFRKIAEKLGRRAIRTSHHTGKILSLDSQEEDWQP